MVAMEPKDPGTGGHARHWERNPYEAAARQKKAYALAARLHQLKITAEEAEQMNIEQWRQLAKATHTNSPSLETQALAIEKLREMEAEAERPKPTVEEVKGYFRRCRP